MKFLKEVSLQESRRTALDNYLGVMGILCKKIRKVEGVLREKMEVTGHISKHRNGFFRWALIQITRTAVHSATPKTKKEFLNKQIQSVEQKT
jgi:hypothetical protein